MAPVRSQNHSHHTGELFADCVVFDLPAFRHGRRSSIRVKPRSCGAGSGRAANGEHRSCNSGKRNRAVGSRAKGCAIRRRDSQHVSDFSELAGRMDAGRNEIHVPRHERNCCVHGVSERFTANALDDVLRSGHGEDDGVDRVSIVGVGWSAMRLRVERGAYAH